MSQSEAVLLVKGITWLARTKLGLSSLLGFISIFVLGFLWNLTHVGSPAFRFIAAVIRPGWNAVTILLLSSLETSRNIALRLPSWD